MPAYNEYENSKYNVLHMRRVVHLFLLQPTIGVWDFIL